jgi:hypothetical protein
MLAGLSLSSGRASLAGISLLSNRQDGVGRKSRAKSRLIPLGLPSNPKGQPYRRCVSASASRGLSSSIGDSHEVMNDMIRMRVRGDAHLARDPIAKGTTASTTAYRKLHLTWMSTPTEKLHGLRLSPDALVADVPVVSLLARNAGNSEPFVVFPSPASRSTSASSQEEAPTWPVDTLVQAPPTTSAKTSVFVSRVNTRQCWLRLRRGSNRVGIHGSNRVGIDGDHPGINLQNIPRHQRRCLCRLKGPGAVF